MNKFWSKVMINKEENAEKLIKAFFLNFNPESSIVLRGKEAKLEIVFHEPPMETIDAICCCEVIEFNYGKNLKEYEEDENVRVETEKDSEQAKAESECSKLTEQPKKKNGGEVSEKNGITTKVKEKKLKVVNIPELDKIAKKATSFEHFVKLVGEWMEMNRQQKFFEELAIVSAEVDNISWHELEKALKNKGVAYTQSDKMLAGQKVSKKLKEQSITMLPLLYVVIQYKDYPFNSEEEHAIECESEVEPKNVEEKTEEYIKGDIPKPRVKMKCMPEIKELEEALASVDKTQPVEYRVRYVLNAMELEKLPNVEQNNIVKIVSTAIRKKKMADSDIFENKDILMGDATDHLIVSRFINNFVQKHEAGRKVKVLDFLSELQEIIMLESEIEGVTKFTN